MNRVKTQPDTSDERLPGLMGRNGCKVDNTASRAELCDNTASRSIENAFRYYSCDAIVEDYSSRKLGLKSKTSKLVRLHLLRFVFCDVNAEK